MGRDLTGYNPNFYYNTRFSNGPIWVDTLNAGPLLYLAARVGESRLPDPSETLYAIWSDANDVFAYVSYDDPITPKVVEGNIATPITNLYDADGRTFLIPNRPPASRRCACPELGQKALIHRNEETRILPIGTNCLRS